MKYKIKHAFTFIIILFATTFFVFRIFCKKDTSRQCTHISQRHDKHPKQYFATTKSSDAVTRCGPGTEYDILFRYSLKNTPLLVVDSHENWRLVVDFYGEESWIHVSLISTRNQYAMCREDGLVYTKLNAKSKTLCRIQKYTIVHVVKTNPYMCRIEFTHSGKKYKGYIETQNLFGVYP